MNPHTVLRTEEIEHIGAEARHLVTHACLAFMSASSYRLQPAAREIRTKFVAEQRNSVNYRFDSLAVHLHLIEFVLATHERGPGRRHRRNGRRALLAGRQCRTRLGIVSNHLEWLCADHEPSWLFRHARRD